MEDVIDTVVKRANSAVVECAIHKTRCERQEALVNKMYALIVDMYKLIEDFKKGID